MKQSIQAAVAGLDSIGQALVGVALGAGEIQLCHGRFRSTVTKFPVERLQGRGIATVQNYVGAVYDKFAGHRPPDTASGSGNQNDPVFKQIRTRFIAAKRLHGGR